MLYGPEKLRCFKVWTSLGIARNLLPFLLKSEQIDLQAINRFWYEAGVGRVITRIEFTKPVTFTWSQGQTYSKTLFEFNSLKDSLDFVSGKQVYSMQNYGVVKIKNDIYAFENESEMPSFRKMSILSMD